VVHFSRVCLDETQGDAAATPDAAADSSLLVHSPCVPAAGLTAERSAAPQAAARAPWRLHTPLTWVQNQVYTW